MGHRLLPCLGFLLVSLFVMLRGVLTTAVCSDVLLPVWYCAGTLGKKSPAVVMHP